MRTKLHCLSLIILIALLGRFVPVYAQHESLFLDEYALPGEHAITLQSGLRYKGRVYEIHYFATGDYNSPDSRFIDQASRCFFMDQKIAGILVTADSKIIEDEAILRDVFALYRSAYYLYEYPGPMVSVDETLVDEMRKITRNPFLVEQQIKAIFKTRKDETAEALRGILTSHLATPDVLDAFGTEIRQMAEQGKTVQDAVDLTIEATRFSNDKRVRELGKSVRKTFKSWRPITEQGTSYVKLGKTRLELFNALDVLSLSVRLLWLVDLQRERAQWLMTYGTFARGAAALDEDQMHAATLVAEEVDQSWLQRSNIILEFVIDSSVELGIRLTTEEIVKSWVDWSWKTYGTRIKGHLVAGVASSVLLGFTLGNLLYGLDDLYHTFKVGERTDELRRVFQAGREELQKEASKRTDELYDGDLAIHFQSACMLESLAAAQMYRLYADGVEATVRKGLLSLLNPINWFEGKEFRETAAEFRNLANDMERSAESKIGHPEFVDAAVDLTMQRLELLRLTVDDASSNFTPAGVADYWQSVDYGYDGRATWTYNETVAVVNSARWTPNLDKPGIYQVQAYIPKHSDQLPKPYSAFAHYKITHAGIEIEVAKSQEAADDSWLDLGTYYFAGDGKEYVQLTDQTGEPVGSAVIVFDAIRWVPAKSSEEIFDASGVDSIPYDIVISGEVAELEFGVQNTGLAPWTGPDYAFVEDLEYPRDIPESLKLSKQVLPGETISWTVRIPVSGAPGVRRIHYRMQRSGEPFGEDITGYVFVLPEQLAEMEGELRRQIEEWKREGEQAVEELIQEILETIQRELERQTKKFFDELCDQYLVSAAMLTLASVFAYRQSRRHQN